MPEPKEEVTLDFSGIEPFLPLDPDRRYLTRVSSLKVGVIKTGENKGGQKVSAEFTVLKPEKIEVQTDEGPKTVKAEGRKLFREYPLMPQALPFFHEFLSANGETKLGDKFKFNPANYLGNEVAVDINNEEYQEQIRSRVRKVLPANAYVE